MISFKEFFSNYKTMGLTEAFNDEIKKTIESEKERQEIKKFKEREDQGERD